MKKFLAMALAAVMVLALAACGSKNDTADDTGDAQDAQGGETQKLIVGFDAEFPPFGFIAADGSYDGFDLAMAKELCARLGWEYEAVAIDWNSKDAELSSGTINCIWNGFTMEGREDDYTFSEPYMLNEQVLVVKKDAGIKSWDDLAGKTVITQTDSAAQDVLEGDQKDLAATFATLDTIGEYNTAFMQLESGAVDAVACDLSIAQYQLAAKPDAYTQLDEPLSSEHYAVGFKKGDTKSADAVAESLKALYEDGTVKDLCDKYSSYGLSFDNWVLK